MIRLAREKLHNTGVSESKIRLIEGSALETSSIVADFAPDTILCIRFANWIDLKTLERLLGVLDETGARHVVIGVSVIDVGTPRLKRLMMRAALIFGRIRRFRQARQYVHDEAKMLAACDHLGWTWLEKVPVFANSSRKNYIYHFETLHRSES